MEKVLFTLKCKECALLFRDTSRNVRLCPSCREKHKRELLLVERAKFKKPLKERYSAPGLPKLSIKEVCRLLRLYNRKHGTNYSYGQFVKKIYEGDLDLKL